MDPSGPHQPLACPPGSHGCTCWGTRGEGSGVLFPAEL